MSLAAGRRLHPVEDRGFAGRQCLGRLLAGRLEPQPLVLVVEQDKAAGRERNRRRGESAPLVAAEAPIVDVVGEPRRHTLGRMKQRDDGAAPRVAADRAPRHQVVDRHCDKADAADDPVPVILEPVIVLVGRIDRTGGNFGHHGQARMRRQQSRRVDRQRATGVDGAAPVRAARAERSGIGSPAHRPDIAGQRQAVTRGEDREGPEITGDVPVEFRLAVDPADLPAGRVAKHVSVVAARNEHVFLAGIDANDAGVRLFGEPALRLAVARDRQDVEVDLAVAAGSVTEAQRKIAVNAALDLIALGAHADRLGDGERAVLGNLHDGIEAMDDLGSMRGRGENERDSESREPEHQRPNATCGTARSASAASK